MEQKTQIYEVLNSIKLLLSTRLTVEIVEVRDSMSGGDGLEGIMVVSWHQFKASVLVSQKSAVSFNIEVVPFFVEYRQRKWRRIGMEFHRYLEAISMVWKWSRFGTTDGVYCLPRGLLNEVWVLPQDKVDQCLRIFSNLKWSRLAYTELHLIARKWCSQWMINFPNNDRSAFSYVIRSDTCPIPIIGAGAIDAQVRGLLDSLSAERI